MLCSAIYSCASWRSCSDCIFWVLESIQFYGPVRIVILLCAAFFNKLPVVPKFCNAACYAIDREMQMLCNLPGTAAFRLHFFGKLCIELGNGFHHLFLAMIDHAGSPKLIKRLVPGII